MPENDHGSPEDIDAALLAIAEAYRARLPERLQAIADSLAQCEAQPGTAAHGDTLVRHIHMLAGSAGTFGLTELGTRATELEIALNDFLASGSFTQDGFAPIAADIRAFLAWAKRDSDSGVRR